jgi:hypothetical protein
MASHDTNLAYSWWYSLQFAYFISPPSYFFIFIPGSLLARPHLAFVLLTISFCIAHPVTSISLLVLNTHPLNHPIPHAHRDNEPVAAEATPLLDKPKMLLLRLLKYMKPIHLRRFRMNFIWPRLMRESFDISSTLRRSMRTLVHGF